MRNIQFEALYVNSMGIWGAGNEKVQFHGKEKFRFWLQDWKGLNLNYQFSPKFS
jgi:hypothetical protein